MCRQIKSAIKLLSNVNPHILRVLFTFSVESTQTARVFSARERRPARPKRRLVILSISSTCNLYLSHSFGWATCMTLTVIFLPNSSLAFVSPFSPANSAFRTSSFRPIFPLNSDFFCARLCWDLQKSLNIYLNSFWETNAKSPLSYGYFSRTMLEFYNTQSSPLPPPCLLHFAFAALFLIPFFIQKFVHFLKVLGPYHTETPYVTKLSLKYGNTMRVEIPWTLSTNSFFLIFWAWEFSEWCPHIFITSILGI